MKTDQSSAPVATGDALNLPTDHKVTALTNALAAETQLINELITVINEQRNAIAEDCIENLDNSVFSLHRILLTLNEARNRRQSIYQLLGLSETAGIKALSALPQFNLNIDLRTNLNELQFAAEQLVREVRINRAILRETLSQKDSYAIGLRKESITTAPAYDIKGSQPLMRKNSPSFNATA